MELNLPTLAEDKGNHWAYGSLISSCSASFTALGLWVAEVLELTPALPLWFVALAAGLVAIAVTALLAKLKERNDKRLNDAAIAAGLAPHHGVEFADIRATVWGGLTVAVPVLTVALLLFLAGV